MEETVYNQRFLMALNEFKKLKGDTCPCKREVVLIEALHGYAEQHRCRMEPTFIEKDGMIPFIIKKEGAKNLTTILNDPLGALLNKSKKENLSDNVFYSRVKVDDMCAVLEQLPLDK